MIVNFSGMEYEDYKKAVEAFKATPAAKDAVISEPLWDYEKAEFDVVVEGVTLAEHEGYFAVLSESGVNLSDDDSGYGYHKSVEKAIAIAKENYGENFDADKGIIRLSIPKPSVQIPDSGKFFVSYGED